jgi:hypothetical protein
MKRTIAIALLLVGLAGSAAQAKLPSVCKGASECQSTQTKAPTKEEFARLKRDIRRARSAAQILERASSSHVFVPLAQKPIYKFTVDQQLAQMQSSLQSAECIVCAHKHERHQVPSVQQLMRKKWAQVDYMLVQAKNKLHLLQLFEDTITPSKQSEEEFNFNLEEYGRKAAQFQELLEEVNVQIAIIEALGQLQ